MKGESAGCTVQAFEQGGGGKKAEAHRVLAEAKAAAKAAAKAGNGQPKGSEDSSAPGEGLDPRYNSSYCHLHSGTWHGQAENVALDRCLAIRVIEQRSKCTIGASATALA